MIKAICEMCGDEIIDPKIRAEGHFVCDNPTCIKQFIRERLNECKKRRKEKNNNKTLPNNTQDVV